MNNSRLWKIRMILGDELWPFRYYEQLRVMVDMKDSKT